MGAEDSAGTDMMIEVILPTDPDEGRGQDNHIIEDGASDNRVLVVDNFVIDNATDPMGLVSFFETEKEVGGDLCSVVARHVS